jgi:hypothetical protein
MTVPSTHIPAKRALNISLETEHSLEGPRAASVACTSSKALLMLESEDFFVKQGPPHLP